MSYDGVIGIPSLWHAHAREHTHKITHTHTHRSDDREVCLFGSLISWATPTLCS